MNTKEKIIKDFIKEFDKIADEVLEELETKNNNCLNCKYEPLWVKNPNGGAKGHCQWKIPKEWKIPVAKKFKINANSIIVKSINGNISDAFNNCPAWEPKND